MQSTPDQELRRASKAIIKGNKKSAERFLRLAAHKSDRGSGIWSQAKLLLAKQLFSRRRYEEAWMITQDIQSAALDGFNTDQLVDLHSMIGILARSRGDNVAATQYLTSAYDNDQARTEPEYTWELATALATALKDQGRLADAIDVVRQAVSKLENDEGPKVHRAMMAVCIFS